MENTLFMQHRMKSFHIEVGDFELEAHQAAIQFIFSPTSMGSHMPWMQTVIKMFPTCIQSSISTLMPLFGCKQRPRGWGKLSIYVRHEMTASDKRSRSFLMGWILRHTL